MRRQSRLRRSLVYAVLLSITLFLVFSLVPTVPYRPWCHAERDYMEGPLRTVWVDQIERLMDEAGMIYLRHGDRIFQPYFDTFDGWFFAEHQPRPWTRFDIRRNLEWRIVDFLINGQRLRGADAVDPPPVLIDTFQERAAAYDIEPPIDTFDETAIYDDCAVKRAAAIQVEKPSRP